jgi:hypothetical protein
LLRNIATKGATGLKWLRPSYPILKKTGHGHCSNASPVDSLPFSTARNCAPLAVCTGSRLLRVLGREQRRQQRYRET